jgi:hypothetical protein
MGDWERYGGYRDVDCLSRGWVRIECPRDGNTFLAPIGLPVFPEGDGKGEPGAEVTCPECLTKYRVSVQLVVERYSPDIEEAVAADD